MSKQDLLIEIGLEEMPARFVTNSMVQFGEKIENWLKEQRISFEKIEVFSTPRRLAVLVHEVAETQEDISEEARGPAKKIALDDEGNWSKAAQGFARGQGVAVDDIFFKEVKGTEYVFVNKFLKGQSTFELLPQLKEIIVGLNFPKNMRWGNYSMRYIRPIQWMCTLYGEQIIPITITDIESSNKSYGHRFLGEKVTITSPKSYKETLHAQSVIVDPSERKTLIRNQISNIEKENNWVIPIDEELLEEVNNLVELPTALSGSFDEKFLKIPDEVLVTSMKEHQRYFPVKQKEDEQLLPYFVTVRNGNDQHLENVAKGNEKVLRARLADAEFFYLEDQKIEIDKALNKLDSIIYREELGSIGDKVRRVKMLANQISSLLQMEQQTKSKIDRAASICKFDLVTNMVGEFTELQGVMGEKYAVLFGEDKDVAKAINEHYKPRSADDSLPSTEISAVVSMADKLDTIVGSFGIGVIPTGSQDPYGLRRQASGIVQILGDQNWNIKIETLVEMTLESFKNLQLLTKDPKEVSNDLVQFFNMRIKNLLQENQVRYDVIDAVIDSTEGTVSEFIKKADLLMQKVEEPDLKEVVEALSRVTNISAKASSNQFDPSKFESAQEKELNKAYNEVKESFNKELAAGNIDKAYQLLVSLNPVINDYFDNTMVMADDETVRNNRLGQMKALSEVILSFANFNRIVFK